MRLASRIILSLYWFMALSVQASSFQCPTAQQLNMGDFNQWQVLDALDDEKIPFDKALQYFQAHPAKNFWVAQWIGDLPNQAQCYYCVDQGCQSNGSGYSDFYLARVDVVKPVGNLWQDMSGGDKHCLTDNVMQCPFFYVQQQ